MAGTGGVCAMELVINTGTASSTAHATNMPRWRVRILSSMASLGATPGGKSPLLFFNASVARANLLSRRQNDVVGVNVFEWLTAHIGIGPHQRLDGARNRPAFRDPLARQGCAGKSRSFDGNRGKGLIGFANWKGDRA